MKPELIKFVAGTKAKASEVNENFEKVLNYAETASAVVSFDIETEYKYGQWVLGQVDDEFGFYESLVDKNKGHLLSDEAFWKKVSMGGGGLEIGDIGIAPLGIDESLGKRRYLNGSVIVQDQYQVFTQRVKTAIQTYAGLGCTEEEWQTIATMSVGGQCGKFVVDDEAGTIRLPKIIMPIQGLTDLTKLGEIVEAGLPNFKGTFNTDYARNTGHITSESVTVAGGLSGSSSTNEDIKVTIDLSNASKVYRDDINTVQQEQIQYPYFIQVATGSEYQENITNEIELNNPFVLLEGEYFTAPVYNSSWLQSNAGFTGSLALHPTAYNALLVEQNPNVEVGTTIDNYTKRGLSVKLDTEAYTDYDFVLNTTSQTFRCPLKINKASGRAVVGNGMGLGLMTAGTSATLSAESIYNNSGTLRPRQPIGQYISDKPVTGDSIPATQAYITGVTTDPTKSGIETSDEGLYLYFYVGETVQNANLVNVGRIEEKLVDKADIDLTNADPAQSFKELSISWGQPDYSRGISQTWNTEYTATQDGFIFAYGICNQSSNAVTLTINGVAFPMARSTNGNTSGNTMTPIYVGNVYKGTGGQSQVLTFFPLKGAN